MLTSEEQARLLARHVMLSRSGEEPLHTQLTRALRHLALNFFEKGERFYTEEELGEKLELSVGTVRRSLNRLVEEGLLQRSRGRGSFVCRTAQDSARALRIIAVANTFDSPFNSLLLRELSYLCQCRNHSLEVINPAQDERVSRAIDVPAFPGTLMAFVFLCLDPDFTYDLVRTVQSRNIPSVNIDTWIPNYPGIQICVENRHGIDLGLAHLSALGHHRIALLLSENPDHDNIRDRVEAFQAGIAARGLECAIIEASSPPDFPDLSSVMRFPTQERYDARIDARAAERVIQSGASAVFCVSDIGAGFLMKRLHAAGMRVPEDISVMGFNDEGICLMMYPELTTIAQPYPEMAAAALDNLEKFETGARHIRIEPQLAVRRSTGVFRHPSIPETPGHSEISPRLP